MRRMNCLATRDVVDGRIAHLESQIGQRTHDALAAPGWVFLEQCDNEFFQFRIHGRSTYRISPGKGPLFGDQDTKPTEQGIWSDECGQFPKAAPTSLALRASRIRWASVKRLGLPPSCSRRMRF